MFRVFDNIPHKYSKSTTKIPKNEPENNLKILQKYPKCTLKVTWSTKEQDDLVNPRTGLPGQPTSRMTWSTQEQVDLTFTPAGTGGPGPPQ